MNGSPDHLRHAVRIHGVDRRDPLCHQAQRGTFTDYAVGGRSFSAWFIAMSYTNSWWPGATYTAFFGLSAGAGVLGLYALAYSLLGVTAMYLMAERAWVWNALRPAHPVRHAGMRFDSRRCA